MMDNLEKQLAVVSKRLDSDELWVMRDVVNSAISELTSLRQYKAEAESQKEIGWAFKNSLGSMDFCHLEMLRNSLQAYPVYIRPAPNGLEIAAKYLEKMAKDYANEHGYQEPDTGAWVFPGNGLDYLNWCEETAEEIRMLSAIPSNSEGEKS